MRWQAYPKYKDSGVEWLGEVPGHWNIKRVKRVTKCVDGKRIPLNSEQRGEMQGEYPYWGANDIADHINSWLFDVVVDDAQVGATGRSPLPGKDGVPFFERYKDVAFYVSGKIWVNNHAHVLRPVNNTSARFLAGATGRSPLRVHRRLSGIYFWDYPRQTDSR